MFWAETDSVHVISAAENENSSFFILFSLLISNMSAKLGIIADISKRFWKINAWQVKKMQTTVGRR
jgi:hypothetical protein